MYGGSYAILGRSPAVQRMSSGVSLTRMIYRAVRRRVAAHANSPTVAVLHLR